jgi:hypothetical protein
MDIPHDGKQLVDALVEGTICEFLRTGATSRLISLEDVAVTLRSLVDLTYEPAELIASFERLESSGRLSFRNPSHRAFVFTAAAYTEVTDAHKRRAAQWNSVRESWLDEVRARHGVDQQTAEALWDGLDAFVAMFLNVYAAEAADFLYLKSGADQTRFYEALGHQIPSISDTVPPDLQRLATEEFPKFFDISQPGRVDFIAARLNASFFFHLLSVDPQASELLRSHVEGKVLYLDSNFLFRLIGFNGPAAAFAPITVVNISQSLNCQLFVSRATVNEFVRAVRGNSSRLNSAPITRDVHLRIAAQQPAEDNQFMAAFYRELQSGQVSSVDQFTRKWTNIQAHLDEWGISVDEDAVLEEHERTSDDFRSLAGELNRWHRDQKSWEAVEHDAFMLRMVRRARGPVDNTPAGIAHWFITFDRQLARYSARHATEAQLPVALPAEAWLQIARPFLPRTDEYDRSFVSMLRHPLLFASAPVPFEHVAAALSRLERYQQLPEKVVSAMLADAHFTRNFAVAADEKDAAEIMEIKLAQLSEDLSRNNEQLNTDVANRDEQLSLLQRNVDILRDARDTEHERRKRAEADVISMTRERDDERQQRITDNTELNTRLSRLEGNRAIGVFIWRDCALPLAVAALASVLLAAGISTAFPQLPYDRARILTVLGIAAGLAWVAWIRRRGNHSEAVSRWRPFGLVERFHKFVYGTLIVGLIISLAYDLIKNLVGSPGP